MIKTKKLNSAGKNSTLKIIENLGHELKSDELLPEIKGFLKQKIKMNFVLIIHEVGDYFLWKNMFDNAAEIRKEAGEISFQLLKYEQNANKIVHFSQWNSIENAKKFFESPKLIQIRKEAGVKAPEFIYLEQIEVGIL